MRAYLMSPSPTSHLPVHGRFSYSVGILKPFLVVRRTSWIVAATQPHSCGASNCILMRAHLRALWARIAHRALLRHTARLALGRTFQSDIALRIAALTTGQMRVVSHVLCASARAERQLFRDRLHSVGMPLRHESIVSLHERLVYNATKVMSHSAGIPAWPDVWR